MITNKKLSIINYSLFIIKVSCLLLLPVFAKAQTDTLSALRQYMDVSNGYKHLPMHVSVALRNSSTFVTTPADTAATDAEFYLVKNAVYIRFGEMEQIVNDSLLLMVSNKSRHMILYPNKKSITESLKNSFGVKMEDSSIQKMSTKYTASILSKKKDIVTIQVKSRDMLYGTLQPKETIIFKYKEKNGMPVEVTQTRRVLIDIDSVHYNNLSGSIKYRPFLLKQNGSFYLIKEQTSAFIYKKIEYGDNIHIPVTIDDRIVKNSKGEYTPVKGYEAFKLNR